MEDIDPTVDPNWYRQRVYDIIENEAFSYEEKRDRLLEIGREFLGVENGHIERIHAEQGVHEVTASSNNDRTIIAEGARFDQANTFYRRTIERNTSLAISDATEQGWTDDQTHRERGVTSYLGASVFVYGEVYGTVCFVDREARAEPFSATERSFVEMIARMLGREREQAVHEAELEQREERLDRVQNKYRMLLSTAPDAIFLVDTATEQVVEANEAAGDLVGYDHGALIGTPFTEFHSLDEHERYRDAFETFVRSEGSHDRLPDGSPLYLRHRDGTDIPVEVNVNEIERDGERLVQGIFRDVTERRDRQEELRVKSRAIDAASIGITIADATTPNTPLIYVNEEFERLTGYDRTGAIGRNCRFLLGEHTDPDVVATLVEAIDTERPVREELLNYRADGTPFWNDLTLTPIDDGHGETTHFVGFQRDITQRKRRERIVCGLNRVLRHNLRNDATVISGLVDRLAESVEEASPEPVERVDDVLARLTTLSEKASPLGHQ